ncbi:hypothetical protein F4819DRAFT_436960 [Hypoxylon fuscum]|nr:hypothetical protein F4819DRAFT_436960 [Hypoxylon fuscum]
MAESSSPLRAATPKRKRDDVINERRFFHSSPSHSNPSKSIFTFQPPTLKPVERRRNDPLEDGSSSPRSRVAQKFQELALESGGGVTHKDKADATAITGTEIDEASAEPEPAIESPRFSPELPVFDFEAGSSSTTSSLAADEMQLDDDDNASRKRMKLPERQDTATAPGLKEEASTTDPSSNESSEPRRFMLQTAVDPAIVRTTKSGGSGRLQKSYPSINRLSDSKSRSRRRAGTPPLSKRKTTEPSVEEEPVVIDPIRAALTWHEDEITVYDPQDKDDDGTGINGIGFKPTPAIAHARAQKRKQQLAEYKKREESEARAKRNERRRGQLASAGKLERQHSIVRVHFSDAEPTAMVTT